MTKEILARLEKLNQLSLTDKQKEDVLSFFEKQEKAAGKLGNINTDNVERMVHVMPVLTVVREDKENKLFTREQLQENAPETTDGYWQVPRLVE